ncbi:MAG TPA: trigger factor [Lachnospiraceae bacterium]|nr:trigger factor [Lachnospiraceae bacterium]
MKKFILRSLLLCALGVSLCACGEKKEAALSGDEEVPTVSQAGEDINLYTAIVAKEYVTLPDYSDKTYDVTFTVVNEDRIEESIKADIERMVDYYGLAEYKPIEGKDTIENGDIVNIDYCGKKDGVAFDGGTAKGYHLDIGSGTFIQGFEDGLVGKKVGEVVELPLKFPDEYYSPDLAGADVIFTVSVNSIDEKQETVIDDAFVKQYGPMLFSEDVTDVESLNKYYKKSMEDACENRNKGLPGSSIFDGIYGESTVNSIPSEITDQCEKESMEYYQHMADSYGMKSIEELVVNYGYDSLDQFKTENRANVEEDAKRRLVYVAIAQKEGIDVKEVDINKFTEKVYKDYGYEKPEDMRDIYDPQTLWIYTLEDKVNEFLGENVKYNRIEEGLLEDVVDSPGESE